jgi:hypothetical protein
MRQEDNPTATPRQGLKDWPGEVHPYEELWVMLEDAHNMVADLISGVMRNKKTVVKYIERVMNLVPYYERQVVGSRKRLWSVRILLKMAISAPSKGMDTLLEDAKRKLDSIIEADEDAKFPGCRNEDGELVLRGGGDE